MVTDQRNWRDAKLPQWVKDSIEAETRALRLTAALAWPKEAKPEPLPFQWGGYDRLIGDPVPGKYWRPGNAAHPGCEVQIRKRGADDPEWKPWMFKGGDIGAWSSNVIRGPLFATEREAKIYRLWLICEECAEKLMNAGAVEW
jgi:hypothetical protein